MKKFWFGQNDYTYSPIPPFVVGLFQFFKCTVIVLGKEMSWCQRLCYKEVALYTHTHTCKQAHTLSLLGHAQPRLNPKWNAVTERSKSSFFCCCKALQNSASHNSQTLHSVHVTSVTFFSFFYSTFLFLLGNSGGLTWVRQSSCKSSATHSYQCV